MRHVLLLGCFRSARRSQGNAVWPSIGLMLLAPLLIGLAGCGGGGSSSSQAAGVAGGGAPTPTFPVSFAVTGSGSVTSNPAGFTCSVGTCSGTVPAGTYTLTATPAAGFIVASWGGVCAPAGTATQCTVNIASSVSASITFTQSFTLSVTVAPAASTDSVSSNPPGIVCGVGNSGVCSAQFAANTPVKLTASRAPTEIFTGWTTASGSASTAGCGVSSTCNITMSGNGGIAATFGAAPATGGLAVSVAGGGTVSATSTPAITDITTCDNTGSGTAACTGTFGTSQTVTVTATPAGGYVVDQWLSNNGTADVIITGACATGTGPRTCTFPKSPAAQFLTVIFRKSPAPAVGPIVLYTDITSGPVGCLASCGSYAGENNNGIYLSVFGKNFGSTGNGTTVKVFLNNVEVTRYMVLGASKGRADIQQLSVQLGALDSPAASAALPIKVVVDGEVAVDPSSLTFTVNPGNIYFVDNVVGVDTAGTATGGTFGAPFKTVQKSGPSAPPFAITSASAAGAWGRVQAGDFIVMRGTGTPWTDIGLDNYFFRAANKSGCTVGTPCAAGGGATSGPITLMGYPNENVLINNTYAGTTANLPSCLVSGVEVSSDSPVRGAISAANSTNAKLANGGFGWNINIVNLGIEGGNDDGVVNVQTNGNFWRVVNNEITATSAINNMCERSGGVVGAGADQFWVGNHIHDIFQGPTPSNDGVSRQNHAIYIGDNPATGPAASYEIAYNHMEKIFGGNGFQIHTGGITNQADNVNLHHNIIHDVLKHGINIADGARNNIVISNNVIYNTFLAGIRFGGTSLVNNLKLYNNTFFNTNTFGTTNYAAILNEMNAAPSQFDIRNNIFVPKAGTLYSHDNVSSAFDAPASTVATNNLWFGGTNFVTGSGTQLGTPAGTFSTSSRTGSPAFVLTTPGTENLRLGSASDARNQGTGIAAVAAVVVDDNDVADTTLTRITRPQEGVYDIGAYEFH